MNGACKKDKVDSCTLVPRSKQDETVRAVTLNVVSLVPRSLTASEELSNFDFPRISTGLPDERFQLKRFIVDSIPLPLMSRIMSRVKSSARERARESQADYSSESIRENEAKGKFRCRLRNLVNWKYLVKQLLYVQTLDGSNSKPRVV